MARFALRAASSLIWGDGGLLFHFILSKIVVPEIIVVQLLSRNKLSKVALSIAQSGGNGFCN